jgi:cyclophilin family peptidyl-prolyl cis-trans isomerase
MEEFCMKRGFSAFFAVLFSVAGSGFSHVAFAASKNTAKKEAPKPTPTPEVKANPKAVRVTMTTSMGVIKLELDSEKAPLSVKNFVMYANAGHYNKTIFHRVINGFMIQGGGFDEKMNQKATKASIKNEGSNGLKNERGTVAMARTNDPDSATAQFFINHIDNRFLDSTGANPGYAVFGKVVSGMETVDAIATVKTGQFGMFSDVPVKPVIIENVKIEK